MNQNVFSSIPAMIHPALKDVINRTKDKHAIAQRKNPPRPKKQKKQSHHLQESVNDKKKAQTIKSSNDLVKPHKKNRTEKFIGSKSSDMNDIILLLAILMLIYIIMKV